MLTLNSQNIRIGPITIYFIGKKTEASRSRLSRGTQLGPGFEPRQRLLFPVFPEGDQKLQFVTYTS
jgi:hypothetical protein